MMHTKKRTPKACDQCRRRKAKCDGLAPCGACNGHQLHCSYGDKVKSLRGPAYVAHLEGKVAELEAKLKAERESSSDTEQPILDGPFDLDPAAPSLSTSEIDPEDTSTNDSTPSKGSIGHELPSDKILPPLVDVNGAFGFGTENDFDTQLSFPVADNEGMIESRRDTLWPHPDYGDGINYKGLDGSLTGDWTNTETPPPLSNALPMPLHPGSLDLQGLIKTENGESYDNGSFEQSTSKENNLKGLQISNEQLSLGFAAANSQSDFGKANHIETSPPRYTQSPVSSTRSRRSSHEGSHRSGDIAQHRERNRLAAAKTRTKKRAAKEKLQEDARVAEAQNTCLTKELLQLRQQRALLRELALQHDIRPSQNCQCSPIHQYNLGTLQETLTQKT